MKFRQSSDMVRVVECGVQEDPPETAVKTIANGVTSGPLIASLVCYYFLTGSRRGYLDQGWRTCILAQVTLASFANIFGTFSFRERLYDVAGKG
jgi:hypothetical protein